MADMTTLEVLRGMRELLSPIDRWTQEDWATDDEGNSRPAASKMATCWCVRGAALRLCDGDYREERVVSSRIAGLVGLADELQLAIWNDTPGRTHAEVLELLDRAIAAAEEAERA